MRSLRTVICSFLVVLCATTALAQFGMYGAPESLQLPQVDSPAFGPAAQPVPAAYSVARPAPTAVYAPRGPQYGAAYGQSIPAAPAPALGEPAAGPSPLDVPWNPSGQRQNLVTQMLNDQPYGGAAQPCDRCQQADCAPALENCCGGCYSCPWYGGVYALVMTRDNGNKLWTSYQDGNNPNQLLNTQDINLSWKWGGEIRFGRRFCCDQWALEADYWTLEPFFGSVSVTNPSGVSTPLHTSEVGIDGYPANTAEDWFDGAAEHRLTRRDEVHSVEINFIRNHMFCDCNTPWSVDWSLGARFFRFEEELTFSSLRGGGSWSNGADSIVLEDAIANNFWGFQVGFNADYRLTHNLRVFATPKFGVYDNHIDHQFQLHLGDGTNANTNGSGVAGTYPVHSYTDRLSFLTQLDLGLDWQFAQRWSAQVGYRVLAVTGIGLADNQIPPYLVDIPAISDIDTNGHLILHGAFAGITYNF